MKQLELKFYNRQQIAEELGIVSDLKSNHFNEKAKTILTNWGYCFNFIPRKGYEIIRKPETAKEKLSEIMIRKYELDIKVDVYAFSVFLTLLLEEPCFASQPWAMREEYLKDEIGYRISERTLRKWCSVLLKHGTINKNKEKKTYWRTTVINGNKIREEETVDDKERVDYWKDFWTLNKNHCENISLTLWNKYHACHYSCFSIEGCAWDDNEREILKEVLELTAEIAGEENKETVIQNLVYIIDKPVEEKSNIVKLDINDKFIF